MPDFTRELFVIFALNANLHVVENRGPTAAHQVQPFFELAKGVAMSNRHFIPNARMSVAALISGALLIGFGTLAGLAASQYLVSQKGRDFSPKDLSIKRGEAVTIVNDDADLRHHAYIDSEKFSFDSGDQEPGSKTSITFPVQGTFDVLCAIHPKMKLVVNVK